MPGIRLGVGGEGEANVPVNTLAREPSLLLGHPRRFRLQEREHVEIVVQKVAVNPSRLRSLDDLARAREVLQGEVDRGEINETKAALRVTSQKRAHGLGGLVVLPEPQVDVGQSEVYRAVFILDVFLHRLERLIQFSGCVSV